MVTDMAEGRQQALRGTCVCQAVTSVLRHTPTRQGRAVCSESRCATSESGLPDQSPRGGAADSLLPALCSLPYLTSTCSEFRSRCDTLSAKDVSGAAFLHNLAPLSHKTPVSQHHPSAVYIKQLILSNISCARYCFLFPICYPERKVWLLKYS